MLSLYGPPTGAVISVPPTSLTPVCAAEGTKEDRSASFANYVPGITELTNLPTNEHGNPWDESLSVDGFYSRIDYVVAAKKLEPEIDIGNSGLASYVLLKRGE